MSKSDQPTRAIGDSSDEARVVRVLDGFLNRRAAGAAVREEDLLAAHPHLADELRQHLQLIQHLRPGREHVAELLRRGILRPRPDDPSRTLLGDFEIDSVVGEGGMGIVLKARDPRLDRTVALKVLRPEMGRDPLCVARFEREARSAGGLQHPNVVTVYGVGSAGGGHYIAMEFVDGPSLAELLRARGPLPAEFVRRLFKQILLGLAAAHRADLIHRDVKSSNVLLASAASASVQPGDDEDGAGDQLIAKIADFGLARVRSAQTQLTIGDSILGTPEYMSPEQARGDAEIDHRTDLYSAGVVLYEMLTGRTPFKAGTPTATIRRILDEEPADPRVFVGDVDPYLTSVALRLIAKSSEDRFRTANEAVAALTCGYHDRRPLVRRIRALATVILVLCVATVGGWWGALQLVPIDRVRRSPGNERVMEAHRPVLGWRPLHRVTSGIFSDVALLFDYDRDSYPDVCAAIDLGDAPPEVIVCSPSGNVLWRQRVTMPVVEQPDGTETPVDVMIGHLHRADTDGVPRGVELFAVLNERLGPRSWLCSIRPTQKVLDAAMKTWSHEPLGHIQSIAIAHRPLSDADDTYSVLSYAMANVDTTRYAAADTRDNRMPLCNLDWTCVPCVSLHRPTLEVEHAKQHSIIFDVPVREAAQARVIDTTSPPVIGERHFRDEQEAGLEQVLVVGEMRFEGGQDTGEDTRIIVTLEHHSRARARGSWRVCLAGTLSLIDCQPAIAPVDSPWTSDEIASRWRRVLQN